MKTEMKGKGLHNKRNAEKRRRYSLAASYASEEQKLHCYQESS